MKLPEIIDLHIHTTFSDGTDTLEELIPKVREAGIELFSVTDHDTIEGARKVQQMISQKDASIPLFIPSVELSCEDEKGKYHILGYGYRKDAQVLDQLILKTRRIRREKLYNRLNFLKERFGIVFSEEEVDWLNHMYNPGKPHIAELLIKHGYAATSQEAMDLYLNKRQVIEESIDPGSVIDTILHSGGIPVLAHPPYGDGEQYLAREELDDRVRRLKDCGLQGIEGYYCRYEEKTTEEMLDLARRYDLYVTAGSDYHGTRKNACLAGHHLSRVSEGSARLLSFLEAVL